MTTLRDILRDFQNETITAAVEKAGTEMSPEEIEFEEEAMQTMLDECIQTIKERLIG